MKDTDKNQQTAAAEPKKSFGSKVGKGLTAAFDFAVKWSTAPLWGPGALAWKTMRHTYRSDMSRKGKATAILGTAGLATAFYAAVAGVGVYGATYGYVAANDSNIPMLNWPATEGSWVGHIIRFSHKGTAPCDSYEGVLQTGGVTMSPDGASTNTYRFSIRKFDKDMIKAVSEMNKNNSQVLLTYRDSGIDQESFENNSMLSCIQHTDHTPISVDVINPQQPAKVEPTITPVPPQVPVTQEPAKVAPVPQPDTTVTTTPEPLTDKQPDTATPDEPPVTAVPIEQDPVVQDEKPAVTAPVKAPAVLAPALGGPK